MHTPNSAELEALQAVATTTLSPFVSIDSFNRHLPMAEFLARSTIINAVLQNNPANCMLVIETANRMNIPVMSLAQRLQVVNGILVWPHDIDVAMGIPYSENKAVLAKEVSLLPQHMAVGNSSHSTNAATPATSIPPVGMQPVSQLSPTESDRVEEGSASYPAASAEGDVARSSVNVSKDALAGGNAALSVAPSSTAAHAAVADRSVSQVPSNGVGASSLTPVARNIDLGTYKEICLRADSSAAVAAAAEQLPQVLDRDRASAEKEVLEQAMICLAEETTVAGMKALATVRDFLSEGNVNIYKGAYNGRAEALNKPS